jgi:ABC-type lipoprotein release transport system permease subunit
MSLLRLAYIIARQRIVSSWRLELVLFLGIVLAVALLSSSVVFSDLLAEAALRRTLQQATPEEANFWVRSFNDLDDPRISGRTPVYQRSVEFVAERVESRFQPFLEDQMRLLETATFFFAGHPQLEQANEVRPRGKIQYSTVIGEPGRTELIAGRWPGENLSDGLPTPEEPLEVVIDDTGARLLQLGVSDAMDVFPASGLEEPPHIPVRIVGVFRRVDLADDFWYEQDKNFSYQDDRWTIIPLFTSERAILERVGRAYPGIYTNVTWVFNLDRRGVQAGEVDILQNTIRSVKADVAANLENGSTFIRLDRVLTQYSEQLLLARIPLFLMVFLVVGILAYYLALVAGLMVRSRSAEIAMLKSRGSTAFQIGLLVLVEGLLLAAPAVILGTLLSPAVAKALGGLFFEVQSDLALDVSLRAFLLGAGGALLAVAVLTTSTLVAARQGIVEFRQSGARPSRAPFIHRYYLDILLLAVIGLIWWQIQTRDSFLVESLSSQELEIDFTLLLGPVLGLLALGLLVLRFFPIGVAFLSRIVEPVGPAWLVQGLRRVSRDPIVPGSLVVLLMLATSLGVIGSAFSSTLDRSQRDRAMYEAGADLRVLHTGNNFPTTGLGVSDLVGDPDSLQSAAEVHRASGHLLTRGFGITRASVLAVDTENFAEVAWYRSDFADVDSLPDLVGAIRPDASMLEDGIRLPPDATALALWVHPDRPDSRLLLQARLRDSRGQYFDIPLGDLSARGWQRLEAGLTPPESQTGSRTSRPAPVEVTPPFTLLSLQVSSSFGTNEPGAVYLDSLAAITPGGEMPLPGLPPLDGWHIIEDYARPGLYALELSKSVTRPGSEQSAVFSWAPGGVGLRGIRYGPPEEPIPAVVSPSILESAEAQVGDTLSLGMSTFALPIRPVAVADFFPTLDPREQPFVVVDLTTFLHYSNRHNLRTVGGANELWVSINDSNYDPTNIIAALDGNGLSVRESLVASDLVNQRVDQPLTNAGWGGLLVLMFLALVLASASGIVLFSYMDTRERQTEFALLRTLGSTRGQIHGVVWFNLFLVATCGIGLGTWAGQQIGASLLPILEVAEGGARVTPPMVFQTNWITLLIAYLVLAGVTAGTVAWLAWLTAKLEVQQVLRAGEAAQ